jgi:hypothetical protein
MYSFNNKPGTQRQTRIEVTLEKQRKLVEETFKDTTKKIHSFPSVKINVIF